MGRLNWRKQACFVFILCAATAIALPAQTFTTLDSFDMQDGVIPHAQLVQATDGNLYGTTSEGGSGGYGTIFKISPGGALSVLYTFCSESGCTDGGLPLGALVQGSGGSLYGTTDFGGASATGCGGLGCGTVFKITTNGTLTTLYRFCSQSGCTDGGNPAAGLVQAADGNFYGTTDSGGTNDGGTVFKITPNGTLTTLYNFCSNSDCTDGSYPNAALVQGADGSLYGTTPYGGANSAPCDGLGCGVVFRITTSGVLTTIYSFCSQPNCTDGRYPNGGLVEATDGKLYGTAQYGGANNDGTVFNITPQGVLTTLLSFNSTDGADPEGALTQGTDGNLYGTTQNGGANNYGTVFNVTPIGTLTTLYSFCAQSRCTDGEYAAASPVQDTDGTFYGTTSKGGADHGCTLGCGTVFSLAVGLGPFVEPQPSSSRLGASVRILGTNLTGATSVTFNGTTAVFTVVSSSFITTTVPAGATTGKVQVVTPGGTLTSNVPFRVLP